LLREAGRNLVRELGVLRASGRGQRLTFAQGHALVELARQADGLTASELGRILGLNKSTTCRTLNQLEVKGHVKAVADSGDPRKKPFVITEKGSARLDELHDQVNQRTQAALDTLSCSERRLVLQGVELYARALAKAKKQP
jgi:DNA-binding MarR family transcriptional regulator